MELSTHKEGLSIFPNSIKPFFGIVQEVDDILRLCKLAACSVLGNKELGISVKDITDRRGNTQPVVSIATRRGQKSLREMAIH